MRGMLVVIVTTLATPLVLLGYITDRPLSPGYAGRQVLPEKLAQPFEYVHNVVYSEEGPLRQLPNGVKVFRATFSSEFSEPGKDPKYAEVLYYSVPSDKPVPAIGILPIRDGDGTLENYFAKYFSKAGFACFIINGQDHNTDLRTFQNFDQAVEKLIIEQRKALDYITSLPEIDAERIFLFGISMGGVKATYLAGIDTRIAASVIVLAGGNLPYLMTHSTESGVEAQLNGLMLKHNMNVEQMEVHLRNTITHDPLTYAPYIDAANTLMVIGRRDKAVPFVTQEQLRAAIGYPQACYLPTGHVSSVICIPFIQNKALRFFQRRSTDAPLPDAGIKQTSR